MDRRDRVRGRGSHPGPIGLGFEIVDIDGHRDDLLVILDVGAAMCLEHQLSVARDVRGYGRQTAPHARRSRA